MSDNAISKKKLIYPVRPELWKYLKSYDREIDLPVHYADLKHFRSSRPLYDKNGNDTLWETVQYSPADMREINESLTRIYALIKTEGDTSAIEHLRVDRVDYCTFGNTNPFRVRIINNYNDNYDYFYMKVSDASRIYGLELEHILSPNRINYIIDNDSLVEEHIAGIPGDHFIDQYLKKDDVNKIRIAKEFIKFNERCFVRLLGDMRAYNFVIDITPDFDDVQYRIRAIDFDQQSYEGEKTIYNPSYFRENRVFVDLCVEQLNARTANQYQKEERALVAGRIKASKFRLRELLDCMAADQISKPEKIESLKGELAKIYEDRRFEQCSSMGDILNTSLLNLVNPKFVNLR